MGLFDYFTRSHESENKEIQESFMGEMIAKLDKGLAIAFNSLTYVQKKDFCDFLIEYATLLKEREVLYNNTTCKGPLSIKEKAVIDSLEKIDAVIKKQKYRKEEWN